MTSKEFIDKISAKHPDFIIFYEPSIKGPSWYAYNLNNIYGPRSYGDFQALSDKQKLSYAYYVLQNDAVTKDVTGLCRSTAQSPQVNASHSVASPTPGGALTPSNAAIYTYTYDWVEPIPLTPPNPVSKCECGAHKTGSNRHSTWCQIKENS
jgi:hypothetical protein